jgi:HK97 family phage prohead protease
LQKKFKKGLIKMPEIFKRAFEFNKNDEKKTVEGYATTFNQPYLYLDYGDKKIYESIDRNALIGADMSDVIMQYDHSGKVLARMSNQTLRLEPDDYGLKIYADLSKSNAAKDLYEEISAGLITKMSWAFTVDKAEFDENSNTYKIMKIRKIYDVSAVSIPANNFTEIEARNLQFLTKKIQLELLNLKIKLF